MPQAPDGHRSIGARLVGLAICLMLMFGAAGAARASEEALLLDIHVNGRAIDKLGEFTLRDGALLASATELRALGFHVPDSVRVGSDGLIALSDLPGVSWRIDQPNQALYATASDVSLEPHVLKPDGTAPDVPVDSASGVTVNYDVNATVAGGNAAGSGLLDVRLFSPRGLATSTFMVAARSGSTSGRASVVRLDSAYTIYDTNALRRYRAGDFISGGLSWSRAVRMGGLQVATDFSIRPDLVTFPLPTITGSASAPSTLDVLAGGVRVLSRAIDPGPFQIPQLPVVTGAGDITVTLTNALGRQVVASLPFYASSSLLAPHLQSFSAQIGAVRRNWSLLSNDYGPVAAIASYRRGLTDRLTLEATGEATAGVVMLGGGLVTMVGNIAVLHGAFAMSSGSGQHGALATAGIQRVDRRFSFAASASVASCMFRDVAAMSGDPVPRLELRISGGLVLGRYGTASVAYAAIDRDAQDLAIQPYAAAAASSFNGVTYAQAVERAHILTGTYALPLGRLSFTVTGYRDFASANAKGFIVGLSMPLGARSSGGVSVGRSSGKGYAQAQVQRSAISTGEWGYQFYALEGESAHRFAQAQYRSPVGLITAGVDQFRGQTSARAELQGSVSAMDGRLIAAGPIDDSFAIVDTNGTGHVHVLYENRVIGVTNGAGRLLVPDLRSFDINHLAIEPTDVPADATIGYVTRDVRPQDRSGVVVRFPIKASHAALLKLVDDAGVPLALGSTAVLESSGAAAPVGYDGATYIQDLAARNRLTVNKPDGRRCSVVFDYRPVPGDIPTIGPLMCLEAAQ
ncbi:fimbria/pilus outer membrane usher protein [Sphingomonas sp. MMS24-J13]|uniref:fimbria/pilus outer membrane usher protein n=1 Tax=Sphingomonas sp. MMS24-J13 TaxID=3238686 RepID=UPI0038502BE7